MNEVIEVISSRKVVVTDTGKTITREFDVNNDDPELALNYLPQYGDAHPTIAGMTVKSVRCDPKAEENWCRGVVDYGTSDIDSRANEFGEVWEWQLGANQTHITSVMLNATQQSLPYPPTSPLTGTAQWHYPVAKDCGTAIGVDGADVKGVDVYRPVMGLKVSKQFSSVSAGQRRTIVNLTGCTNSDYWSRENYRPGQVLFVGANVFPEKSNLWKIEYNFLIGNESETTVVPLIDGTSVSVSPEPWDYIWYRHSEKFSTPDLMGNRVRQNTIESVHIARVYLTGRFQNLNLQGP